MICKLVVPLVLLAIAPAQQVETAREGLIDPDLNRAENDHLNQQAEALLDAVEESLAGFLLSSSNRPSDAWRC